MPKSRVDFWETKLEANRKRDARHRKELDDQGWRVLVVWECEIRDTNALVNRLTGFLEE